MKFDMTNFSAVMNNTEDAVENLAPIITEISGYYTQELDTLMDEIKSQIIDVPDVPVVLIESYFSKLAASLYYIGSRMETLGIRDDISEALMKETYNTEYVNYQDSNKDKKPTAATLTAIAETASSYDSLVNSVYNRAYKLVKYKVEAADRMCSTLSKMLSRRMQEMNYPEPSDALGRKILNE